MVTRTGNQWGFLLGSVRFEKKKGFPGSSWTQDGCCAGEGRRSAGVFRRRRDAEGGEELNLPEGLRPLWSC